MSQINQTQQNELNLSLMKVSDKVKETLKRHKWRIACHFTEIKTNGVERHYNDHYWLYVTIDGEEKIFNVQSDFDVFYHSDENTIKTDIERIKANNKSREQVINANIEAERIERNISLWLKNMFGDTLRDRKTIATIRKYLSDDTILYYVNGNNGIDGLKADKAFFNTVAWKRLYQVIK